MKVGGPLHFKGQALAARIAVGHDKRAPRSLTYAEIPLLDDF
jgi:hypothetical protein